MFARRKLKVTGRAGDFAEKERLERSVFHLWLFVRPE
jgi:hypothetical protein